MERYPVWMTVVDGTTRRLVQQIADFDDPEVAMEHAGTVLVSLGLHTFEVRTLEVRTTGGVHSSAVEVFSPGSKIGVAVLGLSVVDDAPEFSDSVDPSHYGDLATLPIAGTA